MIVLVLGADGQLGSDVLRRARQRSFDITAVPFCRKDLNVADVESIARVLFAQRFDALINCTTYHKTDEGESNAQQSVTINAHAVKVMAAVCRDKNARFVHMSTDYVFDGQRNRPYREDHSPAPLNVYGASKLMGESLARLAHADVLIFRVASLFGVAGARGKGGNFVETMIRVGTDKGSLRVINDQFMSPTATADVARLILKAVAARIPPGIYHAVNSGQASWHEFARQIIERAGINASVEPIPASEYPLPAQRPAYSVLDNSKLANLVGPIPSWTDALDRYLKDKGYLA